MNDIKSIIQNIIKVIDERIPKESNPQKLMLIKGKYQAVLSELEKDNLIETNIDGVVRQYMESYSDYVNHSLFIEMEKVEKIKNSKGDLNKKAELIVKTYEDYLFYNNKEAFEEYWRKRKELTKDKDWKDVDSKIKDTIEYNLNVELKKSGIDIKEVSNNLADDILSIHEGDMKQRNYLINERFDTGWY